MERARETAAPLAREKTLTVDVWPAFTEVDAGNWTGRTFAELGALEGWRQHNEFRTGTAIPGGESAIQVQERFVGGLLRLRELRPHGTVAIVSHGDPIKFSLAYFLGVPLDFHDRLQIDFGSISTLTLDGWAARVIRVNEVPRGEP